VKIFIKISFDYIFWDNYQGGSGKPLHKEDYVMLDSTYTLDQIDTFVSEYKKKFESNPFNGEMCNVVVEILKHWQPREVKGD
jgi:hypothetical protein